MIFIVVVGYVTIRAATEVKNYLMRRCLIHWMTSLNRRIDPLDDFVLQDKFNIGSSKKGMINQFRSQTAWRTLIQRNIMFLCITIMVIQGDTEV